MIMEFQIINYIVMALLLICYMVVIMEFVDTILEGPKLKRWQRIIVGSGNAVVLGVMMGWESSTSFVSYIAAFLILLFEFYIFYRDTMKRAYFVAAACIFHIMAVRAMVVAVFAWSMERSYYEVANSATLSVASFSTTLLLLSVVILIVIKIVPGEKVKIVNQHGEQLSFMIIWTTTFNLCLLVNSRLYSYDADGFVILENQIIMPLAVMIGLYVVLFFAFKTSELLGYQEQHEELMSHVHKERQYREAIVSEALYSYETNFTEKKIISGFEAYKEELGDKIYDYQFMQDRMIRALVHEEDVEMVRLHADSKLILSHFEAGDLEITIEYRRVDPENAYRWVKAITHLYRDKATGSVMGFTYVKDIDKEKQRHLALQERAERDFLTGIYNKGTTEIMIATYLAKDLEEKNEGTLFLIDVDNFKAINDHLGHKRGDEVLCELSEKLKGIFRTDDIVGRIGGDEFLVFMKRASDQETIKEKARAICSSFAKTYESNFGVSYSISASVGVTLYPLHGRDFEELYKRADIALYNSKNKGKNTYSIYQGEEFAGYEGNRTQIDETEDRFAKHFIDNRARYIFQTLYEAKDIADAINGVLELLTKHYNYSRGYIFEIDEDEKTTTNTFERCNDGVCPQIQNLQKVPVEAVHASTESFCKDGKFVVKSLQHLPKLDREVLEPQGIKSMLQFGVFEEGKLKGFVGFDNCNNERYPEDREIQELGIICNIIATFLVHHRALEKIKRIK